MVVIIGHAKLIRTMRIQYTTKAVAPMWVVIRWCYSIDFLSHQAAVELCISSFTRAMSLMVDITAPDHILVWAQSLYM